MNAASALAYDEYMAVSRETAPHRSMEGKIFARVTAKIQQAYENYQDGHNKSAFSDLVAALHDNLQLWDVVKVDIVHPDNALPTDLKSRLFYLSEFMRIQTPKILQGDVSAESIIDINRAIIQGLNTVGE